MRTLYTILTLILSLQFSTAQIFNPVTWNWESKKVSDTEFDLIYTATIDPGWYVYSQYLEGEDGPVKTSFNYEEEGKTFELVGKNVESEENRKEMNDPLFDDMFITKYSKKATFTQRVKVIDGSKPIVGWLEFMTCDDERCLPPSEVDFNFNLGTPEPTKETAAEATKEETQTEPDNSEATANTTGITETIPVVAPSDGLLDPVKWSLNIEKVSESEFDLKYKATIDPNWYVYSQYLESDDGPIKTSFTYDEGEHFETVGKNEEVGSKRKEGKDPLFDNMVVIKYAEEVTFTQRVKTTDANTPITGYLEFMTCDNEKCLPPTEVDFKINLATLSALVGNVDENPIANNPGTTMILDGNTLDQEIPVIRATYENPIGFCGDEEITKGKGLFLTFIFGFLGGLLALLTPCVFPMIPLTVSFFTKSSTDKKSGIKNALIYGLSIIVIYVSIGLLITFAFGATALNALSTDWIANVLFFLIFIFFAFSFFGYYEITLPSSWANKSDTMADKGGLIGIFFMAFTLALVSFSCTGPIIGSALVESATNPMGPFIVMLGFSTALALPFGLFAAFPGWLNSLPQSGGWMNSVKVVLGFLELALAFKFLSVADMTMGWGILPYEIFMGSWVIFFGLTTLYLMGIIRFPHDSPKVKFSPTRIAFIGLFLACTVYLASGFAYNPKTKAYNSLPLMSGLAPPAHYNLFLDKPEIDPVLKAKYPSYSKCANDLDCFKDYYEGLAYAKETGKPLFLDFTGHGCVNCRKTEEHIWINPVVWDKLKNDFVLVSLYVDERKPLDEVLVSKSRNVKLRNVGHKWADFQIINFEQNSQPLYVMMTPEEKVIAKPRGFKEGVQDYIDFMDCGLKAYEENKGQVGLKTE